ncbi:hypothetical protein DFW26_07665 [Clostridioides difficile]|nr:hypothetical protein [Clostridioides difficile]
MPKSNDERYNIDKLRKIHEEEISDIKKYREYYDYNFKFYSSMKEMNSIENIRKEKARIKSALESKNNPVIPFYITMYAAFITIFFGLIISEFKIPFIIIESFILIFFIIILNKADKKSMESKEYQIFCMTSLQILDDIENKKLIERKNKKRR